jgi:hypothetical protein
VTPPAAAQSVVDQLERRAGAMFVSELATMVSTESAELTPLLIELEQEGRVLLVDHPAPDRHLVGTDLRVVGLVTDSDERSAREQVNSVWHTWLREFLATHRCQ